MSHFSICIIAKNEAKTLPRLIESLSEFKAHGGEIVVVDTASIDNTAEVARSLGCKVTEVGEKFVTTINFKLAKKINERFVVEDEKFIVDSGDRLFDYSSARNFSTSLASNDMICTLDCDESYVRLDIDKIDQLIAEGWEQFEYNFIFAHDPWGRPSIEFVQSKFFDRRKAKWEGIVHEVLQGQTKKMFLDRDVILLEHWQEQGKDHRGRYLTGLALDCFRHPDKDRQSHYLARELLWTGRPKSAIREFQRHIAMNKWPAERAQSMIFIGDCYGMLNDPEKQIEWYNKGFYHDGSRREALMKIAHFYLHNKNYLGADVFAAAAMEIGWVPYYANDRGHYTNQPHEILYRAKGWLGDLEGATKHLLEALKIQPYNAEYHRDTKFYFPYATPDIEGWMDFEELLFLYESAQKMDSVCEIGSWKGRSTHALLSSGAKITAVDTWKGSEDVKDATNALAKQEDVFEVFKKNTQQFTNLTINRNSSVDAAKEYPDGSFDMVFIDAGHTYEEVKADIRAWRNKAKILFCGHDYKEDVWMGVIQAVDEELGGIDGVAGTIWYKWISKPKVSIVIPTLGRPDKLHRLLKAIKENTGYDNYEVIVKPDQFPPNNTGVPKLLKQGVAESNGDLVMYLGNDCIPQKDFLQMAVFRMIKAFPSLDGLVGLNDGYWKEGEIATHWLASKKLLPYLGGEFFHTGYYHTGCDNELTEMCRKIDKYVWAEEAKVMHDHPIMDGFTKPLDEVYQLAYDKDRQEHDKKLLRERAKKLNFSLRENFVLPTRIPKIIYTIWLNDKKTIPPLIKKCIKTHDLKGYEHRRITLGNCFKNQYVQDAIKVKMWGKACDYLRCHYLIKEGGIYLDADVEMLPGKNFDALLNNKIFAGRENNNFVNTAVLGAEKGCQTLRDHLKEVLGKFKGDDGLYFQSSLELITPRLYREAHVLTPDYFYPYDHQQGTITITPNTICKHHFFKSWVA